MNKLLGLVILIVFFPGTNIKAQNWKHYSDSAERYVSSGDILRALDFYKKAGSLLAKDSAITFTHANNFNIMAGLHVMVKQYDTAVSLYQECIRIQENISGKTSVAYINSIEKLADVYIILGQYPNAEKYLVDAKELQEKLPGKNDREYLGICYNLGNLYMRMGSFEKAGTFYSIVREHRKLSGVKDTNYAQICTDLARASDLSGNTKDAEAFYFEARNIYDKDHPGYFRVCNYLGDMYSFMKKYELAEPLILEAAAGFSKLFGKVSTQYAAVSVMAGDLYRDMGHYDKAETYYLESKDSREQLYTKNHPEYALVCNQLAVLYQKLGQYKNCEQLLLEAYNIRQRTLGKNNSRYAATCYSLAILYGITGETLKALPFALEAREIREKVHTKNHPDYLYASNILTHVYIDLKDYNNAELVSADAALFIKRPDVRNIPVYEHCCNALASLYGKTGRYSEAEKMLLEVKEYRIRTKGAFHPEVAATCMNMAGLYWQMNEPDKTRDLFSEAANIREYNIEKIFEFTSEHEKELYLKEASEINKKIYSFSKAGYAHQKQGFTYDIVLSQRNLILNSSQRHKKVILHSGDTALVRKYSDWTDLRQELARWYATPVSRRPNDMSDLEEQAEKMEKELARLSVTFNDREKEKINWKTIQNRLQPGEAAVEFVEFLFFNKSVWTDSVFYMALLISKDMPEPELIPLFEKRQLNARLGLSNESPGQHQVSHLYRAVPGRTTRSLYEMIWEPIAAKLTGIKTVYFSPAGLLHKVSFAAISVNEKVVLSDRYHLVQLNTTGSSGETQGTVLHETDQISLFGGIEYDIDSSLMKPMARNYDDQYVATRSVRNEVSRKELSPFKYLYGTISEVTGIKSLTAKGKFKAIISAGKNATEEAVKHLSGKNSPSVLHIATHGFFFPDPENSAGNESATGAASLLQADDPLIRSGLALAGVNNAWKGNPVAGVEDGILTAYEIASMYLPNTKLAVLSACETGLGDIQGSEGVYGLQRAFKIAGVENLVMSLWKVPDLETSEFMHAFYQNLFSKQSIRDAFNNAQTLMKNKYRNDPYKWAAWVLVR